MPLFTCYFLCNPSFKIISQTNPNGLDKRRNYFIIIINVRVASLRPLTTKRTVYGKITPTVSESR